MKLGEIGEAFPVLMKLSKVNMEFGASYKLYKVISKLQSDFDIFSKRQYEILKECGEESEAVHGRFSITRGREDEFYKKIEELKNTESEAAVNKLQIPITEELKLSAGDIKAVEIFVDFIE